MGRRTPPFRFGGYGFDAEYDVERKFRETRLYQVAPISTNLILSYVAEHVLGLPILLRIDVYVRSKRVGFIGKPGSPQSEYSPPKPPGSRASRRLR